MSVTVDVRKLWSEDKLRGNREARAHQAGQLQAAEDIRDSLIQDPDDENLVMGGAYTGTEYEDAAFRAGYRSGLELGPPAAPGKYYL